MTAELVCAATDPAWLYKRREGITATDIVTIAGLVTWDSPWALYHRKLGLLPEVEQSDRMRLGSWLERAIADEWWFAGPGRYLSDRYSKGAGGLYRSTSRTWQMATPDWLVYDDSESGKYAVLECKTWDERQGKHDWGPDGSGQVPAKVRAQVLWQMDTLGVGTGHVAVVFLPSGEFRSYTIRCDQEGLGIHDAGGYSEFCAACEEIDDLRDRGFGFWSRILRRDPPDLDGLEVTTNALRYLHPAPGGQVELVGDVAHMVESYDGVTWRIKDMERRKTRYLNTIREAMGDAHEATVDGRVVFRRTIGKRAGYTVAPAETDILRRIGKDKD